MYLPSGQYVFKLKKRFLQSFFVAFQFYDRYFKAASKHCHSANVGRRIETAESGKN